MPDVCRLIGDWVGEGKNTLDLSTTGEGGDDVALPRSRKRRRAVNNTDRTRAKPAGIAGHDI